MSYAAGTSSWSVGRTSTLRRLGLFGAILLSGGNLMIPRLPLAAVVLLLGVLAVGSISTSVSKRKVLIYVWLILVITFAFIRSQYVDVSANVTRFANFLIGLMLLRTYWDEGGHRLVEDLKVLLLPLAFLGILTVAVATVAPGLFVLVHVGQQRMFTVLGLLNYAVPLVEDVALLRPIGFFWEPGIFQVYLNILLFILLAQKARLTLIVVAILAVILTQSTTGIVIALAQLAYFVSTTLFKRGKKNREVLMLVFALAALPALFLIAEQNVVEKFSGALSGSSAARAFDLSVAIQVIRENPFLGIGFSERAYMEYAGSTIFDASVLSGQDQSGRFSTNGVMIVLYSVGLPLGLIFLMGFYFQSLVPHRFMFGSIILVSLTTSPLAFTPFFIFLAFNGLALGRWNRLWRFSHHHADYGAG